MSAQGYRQLRWAAASVCLLLLAVLGGRAAERQERHERAGAASMAMAAAATSATTFTAQLSTPTRMLSMAEIRAHTAASARLKRKATAHASTGAGVGSAGSAAAGKRDRVGEEPNVHGVKYAAAVQPNAKLLRLLKAKAGVYEKSGSAQMAAAHRKQDAAKQEKALAEKEMKRASAMQEEAKTVKKIAQVARQSFDKGEEPTLSADKAMKLADKHYRHDMLKMAKIYPQVNADKAAGRPVPEALTAELQNVTVQLKADELAKKKDQQMLATAASASTNSFYEAAGRSPEDLQSQSAVYTLDQGKDAAVKKAKNAMQLANERMVQGKQEETVAKRVLGVADCIQKAADRFRV